MKWMITAACCLSTLAPALQGEVMAQNMLEARSLGMAGSNAAAATGLEYLGGNPAFLAFGKEYSFELVPFSARLKVSNNSFSLDDYRRYFTSGADLSEDDKDYIYSRIPDDGLIIDAAGGLEAVSFSFRSVGFALVAEGNGVMDLPRQTAEFLFYGNTRSDRISFNELETDGWGGITVNMAFSGQLSDDMFGALDRLSAGINLKYIRGLACAELIRAEGGVLTTDQYILADGLVNFRTSEGGNGFGADIGFAASAGSDWKFSLSLNNILGSIKWTGENKMHIYQYQSDSLSTGGDESFDYSEHDTTFSTGAYHTALSRSVTLAAAFRQGEKLLITAAWRQGINESLGGTFRPRFSLGAEYSLLRQLPLRGGLSFGGRDNLALGLGIGLVIRGFRMDIGYLNHSFGWFNSARSVDLAFTTRLRF